MNQIPIRQGDILLFDGEHDWIDEAIMFLTNSKVTHAAMCVRDGALADAGLSGVGRHAFSQDPAGRGIHVRRLLDAALPTSPLAMAADHYVAEVDPYDKPGLVLLALILLYKKFTPSSPTQKLLTILFKGVAARLDKWIDSWLYKGKTPMVCSQFVFQCYQDASLSDPRYALTIRGGTFSALRAVPAPSLLQQAAMNRNSSRLRTTKAPSPSAIEPDLDEALGHQLLPALKADLRGNRTDLALDDELVESIHILAAKFQGIASGTTDGIAFLQRQESLFVTPADLLSHCPSLVDEGTTLVLRKPENLP
jgi:hypothetical protein